MPSGTEPSNRAAIPRRVDGDGNDSKAAHGRPTAAGSVSRFSRTTTKPRWNGHCVVSGRRLYDEFGTLGPDPARSGSSANESKPPTSRYIFHVGRVDRNLGPARDHGLVQGARAELPPIRRPGIGPCPLRQHRVGPSLDPDLAPLICRRSHVRHGRALRTIPWGTRRPWYACRDGKATEPRRCGSRLAMQILPGRRKQPCRQHAGLQERGGHFSYAEGGGDGDVEHIDVQESADDRGDFKDVQLDGRRPRKECSSQRGVTAPTRAITRTREHIEASLDQYIDAGVVVDNN
jgi:hypothetical protein